MRVVASLTCRAGQRLTEDSCAAALDASQQQQSIAILEPVDEVAGTCAERSASLVGVHVNSAATHLPLFHALIRLKGSKTSATVFTSQTGYASFADVPPGLYRVVIEKPGLRSAASAQFHVDCRKGVALRALLSPAR
jgi:hypothetical protein